MTLMQPLKIYMVFTQIIKKVYLMPMFQNLQKKNKNKKSLHPLPWENRIGLCLPLPLHAVNLRLLEYTLYYLCASHLREAAARLLGTRLSCSMLIANLDIAPSMLRETKQTN